MDVKQERRPNPQGKGQSTGIGFLVETSASIDLPDISDDSEHKILRDVLSSLFVISCDFKFSPVRGREYYIYSQNGRMLLSLVCPAEGGEEIYEQYLGRCWLRDDFTWALLFEKKGRHAPSYASSEQDEIDTLGKVKEMVKRGEFGSYDRSLGYYQNVLKFVLGKSVDLRRASLASLGSGSDECPVLLR